MMFLTMHGVSSIFTTKGTKFARSTRSADELCAFLALFVVAHFDPSAGQGMSASSELEPSAPSMPLRGLDAPQKPE
jgi:hypothetical protein